MKKIIALYVQGNPLFVSLKEAAAREGLVIEERPIPFNRSDDKKFLMDSIADAEIVITDDTAGYNLQEEIEEKKVKIIRAVQILKDYLRKESDEDQMGWGSYIREIVTAVRASGRVPVILLCSLVGTALLNKEESRLPDGGEKQRTLIDKKAVGYFHRLIGEDIVMIPLRLFRKEFYFGGYYFRGKTIRQAIQSLKLDPKKVVLLCHHHVYSHNTEEQNREIYGDVFMAPICLCCQDQCCGLDSRITEESYPRRFNSLLTQNNSLGKKVMEVIIERIKSEL